MIKFGQYIRIFKSACEREWRSGRPMEIASGVGRFGRKKITIAMIAGLAYYMCLLRDINKNLAFLFLRGAVGQTCLEPDMYKSGSRVIKGYLDD